MKIDKGVPLPFARGGANSELGKIIAKMKVGDSILFPTETEARRFSEVMYQHLRGTPYRQCSRKTPEGFRVWKVKRDAS